MVQKGESQDYFINNFSSCWWKVFFFKKRPRSGETGAAVSTLTMLMDGADAPKEAGAVDILTQLYLSPMEQNIKTLMEVLK